MRRRLAVCLPPRNTPVMILAGSDPRAFLSSLWQGKAALRLIVVIVGGMLALQSSPDVTVPKIAYLAVALVVLAVAAWSTWREGALRDTPVARRWLVMSLALGAILNVSFAVARSEGTPIGDWARDAVSYALFATVPIFAIDAAKSTPRGVIVSVFVAVGILGAFSWASHWILQRSIADLPISRLLFPSAQIPAALYLFAMATAVHKGHKGRRWALLAGLVLGLFLVTGTRSSLLLLAGPLVMMAVNGRERLRTSLRWLVVHGSVAVVIVLAFQAALLLPITVPLAPSPTPSTVVGGGPSAPPDNLGERFGSIGSLITNPAADPSVRERLAQYESALQLFLRSPLVGVGPGHRIEWTDVSGDRQSAFTADTPIVFLAKFGLVGLIPLGLLVWAYVGLLRGVLRHVGVSAMALTLVGYGVSTLVGLPLGFLIEDKGTSFALILILALSFGELITAPPGDRGELVASAVRPIVG